MFGLTLGKVLCMASVVLGRYLGRPPRCLPVLLLFLTDRCNLRCRMCGVCERDQGEAYKNELSSDEWRSVIAAAADHLGTFMMSISGGEAMIRQDLCEIISFAVSKGIHVHLCSNGFLFTEEKVDALRDAGVSMISISVDGPDAETHDFLRGKKSFEAAVRAIRLVRERAPEVFLGINFLIAPHNYLRMQEMVSFAKAEGIVKLKFAPLHTNLVHRYKSQQDFDGLFFKAEELPLLEAELQRTRKACAAQGIATTSDGFFKGIPLFYQGKQSFRCYAGYAVCAISPYGEVMPCCDHDTGLSVKDRPLNEIWHDPVFHEARKRVHHCKSACWDTTNTELSLRLRPETVPANALQILRDLRFYFGKKK